ncbi:hypothetical protein ACWD3J_47680 [Streptomyces sp. NPDC002755]|uniref:hypothetical protein n=1 Tax=Streptomyces sp. NPDC002884 TaxID=3154544 RepID=UPI003323B430
MTSRGSENDYGPHSPDYGLSYDPDPWADPEPVDDPDSWESEINEDYAEAEWEQALREGLITREQFSQRRTQHESTAPTPEAPNQAAVIRSAVEKLRAKLASNSMSKEEMEREEKVLASLEQMLKPS